MNLPKPTLLSVATQPLESTDVTSACLFLLQSEGIPDEDRTPSGGEKKGKRKSKLPRHTQGNNLLGSYHPPARIVTSLTFTLAPPLALRESHLAWMDIEEPGAQTGFPSHHCLLMIGNLPVKESGA